MKNVLLSMLDLIRIEPAMFGGVVVAALALLVAFGVHISGPQQDAIKGFVEAVLIIVGAVVVRSQVVPKINVVPAAAKPSSPAA